MSLAAFSAALDVIVADGAGSHANFNAEEKELFMAWAQHVVPLAIEFRKLALKAETLDAQWEGGVKQAVQFLVNNETLPNPTDNGGVSSLLHPTDATSDWQVLADMCKQILGANIVQVDVSGDAIFPTLVRAGGINVQG